MIEHSPNTDNFKYDTKRKGKVHFSYEGKEERHGYFLEGKLGLLMKKMSGSTMQKDSLSWAPKGRHPRGFEIRENTILCI